MPTALFEELLKFIAHWCIFEDFGIDDDACSDLELLMSSNCQRDICQWRDTGIYIHKLCLHIPVHNGEEDDITQDDWNHPDYDSSFNVLSSHSCCFAIEIAILQYCLGVNSNSCWRLYMEAARIPWNEHKSKVFILLAYYILICCSLHLTTVSYRYLNTCSIELRGGGGGGGGGEIAMNNVIQKKGV